MNFFGNHKVYKSHESLLVLMKNIIHISPAELAQKGKLISGTSLVYLNKCIFKRGVTFSLEDKEKIIKSYQSKSNKNIKYLLVENKFYFTIWSEEKSITLDETKQSAIDKLMSEDEMVQAQEISSQDSNYIEKKIPTKKITKKYRGQTYEVEVPDLSYEQLRKIQPQKKRLKYRGKYID